MRLKCPECRKAFKWDTDNPWPRFCPLCLADINNDRDDDDIVMPFIQCKGLVKSSDALYRKIEAGSETRQEMAAAQLGLSKQDVAELKITDLQDARQPGQVAAVPVSNAVTQVMEQPAANGAFGFTGNNGLGFSGPVGTGAFANSGAKFQSVLRKVHAEGTGYRASGDLPANEINQPG